MLTRLPAATRCVALTVVLTLALLAPCNASTGASRTGTIITTAATWAAVPTLQGTTPTTGTHSINWSVSKGAAYAFMDAVNTGTVALSGQSYTITTVPTQNGNQKTPTITLDACVGAAWNAAANTCSGVVTRMGAAISGTFASPVALDVRGRLSIRVVSDGPPGASFLTTLSITVTRDQARRGSTTTS